METMRDFLSILRTDRKREMAQYKEKDYLVPDNFRMIRKIIIEDLEIGVQVDAQDYHFYLIEDNQNAYFSISDIYGLLRKMSLTEGKAYVKRLLQRQLDMQENAYLVYEDISYEIKKSILPDREGEIEVDDGSKQVKYKQLFVLLNLIQQKSNAMFENSPGNESYKDGIVRLLKVLIDTRRNHSILKEKGWYYSKNEKKFYYKELLEGEEKRHKKYYLTEGERDSIMSLES